MMLEIDAGNTFIKWRLLQEQSVVQRGKYKTTDARWSAPESWQKATHARVASVAGEAVNARIASLVESASAGTAVFIKTVKQKAGVTNSYADPSRMGVDRWLVMLAAYNDCKTACCIVDCGSAITVDFVAADGLHEGGYIIPGLRLMNRSLTQDTAEIIVDQDVEHFDLSPGTHTSAAVGHGVNYLFHALCQQLKADVLSRGCDYQVYLTGGDGELFHKLVGIGIYIPDLVMDGLRWGE